MSNVYNCTDGGFPCTTSNITSNTTVSFANTVQLTPNGNLYNCPGFSPNLAECQAAGGADTYNPTSGCRGGFSTTSIPSPPNLVVGREGLDSDIVFCPGSNALSLCQFNIFPTSQVDAPIVTDGIYTSSNITNNMANYQCSYSIDSFIDKTNNSLIENIPKSYLSQTAMQQVYSYYCSLQAPSTQSCPVGPLTTVPGSNIQGISMSSCSNMLASNSPAMVSRGYQSCQDFFSQSNGHNACYNASIQSYCISYPGASDCQCVNYGNNTLFNTTASGAAKKLAVVPTCWWAPCQAPNNSLIPRCVTSGPFTPANNLQCPNTQCVEIIQNNIVGGNLNNNPTQQCTSTTNNTNNNTPVVTNNTNNPGTTTTTTMTKGISKEDSKIAAGIIVGVIIIIALIVGGFILYEIFHKK